MLGHRIGAFRQHQIFSQDLSNAARRVGCLLLSFSEVHGLPAGAVQLIPELREILANGLSFPAIPPGAFRVRATPVEVLFGRTGDWIIFARPSRARPRTSRI